MIQTRQPVRLHFLMKKIIIGALLTLIFTATIFAIAAWSYINNSLAPIDQNSRQTVQFSIQSGESVSTIAANLNQAGLIKHSLVFRLYTRFTGIAPRIQAGKFNLSPSMDVATIATTLTSGFQDQATITILEGWRREEIADNLASSLVGQSILFNKQEFLRLTQNLEGKLFPDTYFIPEDASEQDIVTLLTSTYQKKTDPFQQVFASSGKTEQEILTMASIIEREARTDRSIVSGILWKRIDNDWPLQVDAALQYVKGYNQLQDTWWPIPLAIDKDLDSPYNTYQNQGLPPAPICNPSLDSILAAAEPTASEDWFYITDNQGHMRYAQTLDQHNANVQKYLR